MGKQYTDLGSSAKCFCPEWRMHLQRPANSFVVVLGLWRTPCRFPQKVGMQVWDQIIRNHELESRCEFYSGGNEDLEVWVELTDVRKLFMYPKVSGNKIWTRKLEVEVERMKKIWDIEKEGLLRFSDYLASKVRSRKKKSESNIILRTWE